MQSISEALALEIVQTQAILAFIGLIVYFLVYFSNTTRYRYWASAWTVFGIAALGGVLFYETTPFAEGIVGSAAILSSLLLLKGASISNRILSKDRYILPLSFAGGSLIAASALFISSFSIRFFPAALLWAYSSLRTTQVIVEERNNRTIAFYSLVIGLLILSGTLLAVILNSFLDIAFPLIVLAGAALFATGAGFLGIFIEDNQQKLNSQYQLSSMLSGIIQHDLRNYMHIAQNALELTEIEDEEAEHWLKRANVALQSGNKFIDGTKGLTTSLISASNEWTPVNLREILESVVDRVTAEYNLINQIQINDVDPDCVLLSNELLSELLWNILDNAFKHGGTKVEITTSTSDSHKVDLVMRDNAGGLSQNQLQFLNQNGLPSDIPDNIGLGLIIINGLASISSEGLEVSLIEEAEPGTEFRFSFSIVQ